jgi:hypothetical protein
VRVAHFPASAARLGSVERLDLAFLVDRDHHRLAGRVHVETDDIIKLSGPKQRSRRNARALSIDRSRKKERLLSGQNAIPRSS